MFGSTTISVMKQTDPPLSLGVFFSTVAHSRPVLVSRPNHWVSPVFTYNSVQQLIIHDSFLSCKTYLHTYSINV